PTGDRLARRIALLVDPERAGEEVVDEPAVLPRARIHADRDERAAGTEPSGRLGDERARVVEMVDRVHAKNEIERGGAERKARRGRANEIVAARALAGAREHAGREIRADEQRDVARD